MSYLDDLSAPQREAVEHTEGPLLIIAGAGAGKTKTITYRIFHLIKKGVRPDRILAVTFTNKAAKEMHERVARLLEETKLRSLPFSIHEQPFIGTFHALGVHILREKGHEIGIEKRFTIKDQQDSLTLIKEAMAEEAVDPKRYEPKRIQHIISQQKNALIRPERYASDAEGEYFPSTIARVWIRYEHLLAKNRSLDFDDLIGKPIELLTRRSDVRTFYTNTWSYIHIDEYQDTNDAQHTLVKLLAGSPKMNHTEDRIDSEWPSAPTKIHICAVGDTDQTIYSWRGANIKNILRFEKDFPGTCIVMLEENYRSTATILHAANDVIKNNTLRHEKKLFTQKGNGEKISLANTYNEKTEGDFVAETAEKLIASGIRATDIAVLYRANFQSRVLEEAFLARNLPYQVLGTRFFERKEIKDILSYIRAALNPEDLGAIKRIINIPARGIGKVTLAKLFAGQKENLSPALRSRVDDFYDLLAIIGKQSAMLNPAELIKFVLERSGIEAMLRTEGEEGRERLENIRELVTLAVRYAMPILEANLTEPDSSKRHDAIEKFLSDAALASDQDELMRQSDGVRFMTIHAAKGLEFQYVFIVGLEQGLFPHTSEAAGVGGRQDDNAKLEEERRLFYVAITRAGKKLYLSFADTRTIFGTTHINAPSQFLSEISDDILELERIDDDTMHHARPKVIYFD